MVGRDRKYEKRNRIGELVRKTYNTVDCIPGGKGIRPATPPGYHDTYYIDNKVLHRAGVAIVSC